MANRARIAITAVTLAVLWLAIGALLYLNRRF